MSHRKFVYIYYIYELLLKKYTYFLGLTLILLGHMHLRGCYDWFRPPRTKYEIWLEQHEKRKKKRLLDDMAEEDI